MKTLRFCKQKGIGLLELMLSLAIIAILLIMATRYYQSASNSQAMSSAVDMVNAVKSGVKNYLSANTNSTTFPDVATLVQDGYLPQSYSNPSSANPWSGEICIGAAITSQGATPASCSGTTTSVSSSYSVVLTGVPDTICTQLANRLQGTINTSVGEYVSKCDSGSVSVTYIN
jgi:type II secretory pathway pseudopilin PulG